MDSSRGIRSAFDPERFDPADWRGLEAAPLRAGSSAYPEQTPANVVGGWLSHVIPAQAQRKDDCVGHATAMLLTAFCRRYAPEALMETVRSVLGTSNTDWRISGYRIWRRRKEQTNQLLKGGLHLHEGILALGLDGILPAGCEAAPLIADNGLISRTLMEVPVLEGYAVHGKWAKPSRMGYIARDLPNPFSGHAVCRIGTQITGAATYAVIINSWGEGWGWHGCGNLDAAHWLFSQIGGPVTLARPAGSDWPTVAAYIAARLGPYIVRTGAEYDD